MQSMLGMRKESAPKNERHTAEAARPMSPVQCFFSFNHCSRKMTTNMAVMTNSMPSVSKVSIEPKIPPSVAPETQ